MKLNDLKAEFPRLEVHWRAQTVTRDGSKALALAYIDARAVMNRLDDVVGGRLWQDEYTSANGRTICRLGIRIGDEWVWKSDGAGDTQVEAEKGGISDAFKRAAVKWGIGRYLYEMPSPWVPCESYEKNGKHHFRKFKVDPWTQINAPKDAKNGSKFDWIGWRETILKDLANAPTDVDVTDILARSEKQLDRLEKEKPKSFEEITDAASERRAELSTLNAG